jgi:hypothetical protein
LNADTARDSLRRKCTPETVSDCGDKYRPYSQAGRRGFEPRLPLHVFNNLPRHTPNSPDENEVERGQTRLDSERKLENHWPRCVRNASAFSLAFSRSPRPPRMSRGGRRISPETCDNVGRNSSGFRRGRARYERGWKCASNALVGFQGQCTTITQLRKTRETSAHLTDQTAPF